MKILITGSAGFVGSSLVKHLGRSHEAIGLSRRASETTRVAHDLLSPRTHTVLSSIDPDMIIHCAGLTNVDYCENNKNEAYRINFETTQSVADWTGSRGKLILLISTDYVYPGKTNNYDEESEVDPVNYYGCSKLTAERITRALNDEHLILRPTVVFSYKPGDKNFMSQITSLREVKKVPYDQISNPTHIKLLTKYVERAIEQGIRGTYVATGPESIDRLSFAHMILDEFGMQRDMVEGIDTASLGQIAQRPLANGTNSSLIRKVLNMDCPSLAESVREERRNAF